MFLTNFPNIRVHKYPKGYVVEIQKRTWYGRKYWAHIISVSGMASEPWYYQDFDSAITEASKYFGWELVNGSQ